MKEKRIIYCGIHHSWLIIHSVENDTERKTVNK